MFFPQWLLNIIRHILPHAESTVGSVLRVGSCASHYETAGGEQEVEGEDQEVSVESSLDEAVPFDFQQIHNHVFNQI